MIIGRAWLAGEALAFMQRKADRCAPLETGGVLLGYRAMQTDEPVITAAIGPGKGAFHGDGWFVPDQEFHVQAIAKAYHKSGRRITYLGDWHTHPGGGAGLSLRDRKTLYSIARTRSARAPRPVMLILASGAQWHPKVWQGSSDYRCLLLGMRVRAMPLVVF